MPNVFSVQLSSLSSLLDVRNLPCSLSSSVPTHPSAFPSSVALSNVWFFFCYHVFRRIVCLPYSSFGKHEKKGPETSRAKDFTLLVKQDFQVLVDHIRSAQQVTFYSTDQLST